MLEMDRVQKALCQQLRWHAEHLQQTEPLLKTVLENCWAWHLLSVYSSKAVLHVRQNTWPEMQAIVYSQLTQGCGGLGAIAVVIAMATAVAAVLTACRESICIHMGSTFVHSLTHCFLVCSTRGCRAFDLALALTIQQAFAGMGPFKL